jgi:hypothetical protein
MSKRFTDTDKWKKSFIKSLPTEYKLFWLYLLDDCNHAGIWHVELEVAQARLGIQLSIEKIRGFFKERIVEFDGGAKWFIPDFITFQYGSLRTGTNVHNSIIQELDKYNLQGLLKGSRTLLDKDKDKDKDKEGIGEKKETIGMEAVTLVANKVWNDQRWKETVCQGHYLKPPELQRWMAQYNASISNDVMPDFSEAKYKKLFGGWLNTQKAKGYKLPEQAQQQLSSPSLKTLE